MNNWIKRVAIFALGSLLLMTACSSKPTESDSTAISTAITPIPSTAISAEQLLPAIQPIDQIRYPDKKIIALGEATHGNKEFTELKLQVFQQLVEQKQVRAFAIEGDMGGSAKVNAYIQGGAGTAEEAVSEIGFAIYRTQEMAELAKWMRSFNEGREPADRIRFYGYDMQRYDNNKEQLLSILNNSVPELGKEYASVLTEFTDATMNDLDSALVQSTFSHLESLNRRLDEQQEVIIAALSEEQFLWAQQYAEGLKQNTELRLAGKKYGTVRDAYMADNVEWILQYEERFHDLKSLFITGHNGHIGKTTATFGTAKITGELLKEKYGDDYFAIGTEFYQSSFLANDQQSSKRQQYQVQNSGDTRLAVLLHHTKLDSLYLDLDAARNRQDLTSYLETKQPMSSIGDMFSDSLSANQAYYTQKMAPALAYNGILFVDTATPSTMLE
ncbi:erythromycin esterase family protein [Cohnella sp. LGH]|uniref:erythromycin esterase family protein n=1 Tax=Cohnella sp. LGH TaxID=1619153 RepID=UPI001AD98D54|nr:erythromycin esterase family protein [Cohnella sp. LGH]QTH44423.1 erythromycin esterase family protein [Cohnella sp. LGH]